MSIAMPADTPQDAPAAPPPGPTSPTGRLRHEGLGETDRNFAIAIHLSPILGATVFGPLALLAPLVLWLIRRDRSVFVDDHGREALNFVLSFILLHVILILTIIGALAIPVLWIVAVINVIRAAIAAGSSEYFRYPLTIRFLR